MQVSRCFTLLLLGAYLACLTTGCRKKIAVSPPAPPAPVKEVAPPPPSAPTASLTAEPSTVEPGQSVTLKWSTKDATETAISGVGSVELEGRTDVRPEKSTTYELVAKGRVAL
jgi:peptidoglycan-associated lipoprotein